MQFILYYSLGILCTVQLIILGNRYIEKLEPNEYKSQHWLGILSCSLLFPFWVILFFVIVINVLFKNTITNLITVFKRLILILLKPIF